MANLSPKELDILEIIRRKPKLEVFFFRKAKGVQWFDELKRRDYFDPKHNLKPVESKNEGYWTIKKWNALDYLVNTAPELSKPENAEFRDKFVELAREITIYSLNNNIENYRTWWMLSQVVYEIPLDQVSIKDIELFSKWIKDPFDSYLVARIFSKWIERDIGLHKDAKQNIVLLLSALSEIRWDKEKGKGKKQKAHFYIKSWYAKEIMEKLAPLAGKYIGVDAINIFIERLKEYLDNTDDDKYSYIWRPAIEDNSQNHQTDSCSNILVMMVRDSILSYSELKKENLTQIVLGLLNSNYIVLKRIAIFLVNENFSLLNSLASEIVSDQYLSSTYKYEMYHFLERNYGFIGKKLQSKIINSIESIDADSDDNSSSYRKLEWLSAIKSYGDEAEALFNKYYKVVNVLPEHPDFSFYMSTGWVGDVSKYSKEELLEMDIRELVAVLEEFKEEPGWNSPTKRGLATTFKEVLKSDPEKYSDSLEFFANLELVYCDSILEAFQQLWKERKYDNWSEILQFADEVIHRDKFWEAEPGDPNRSWIANRGWFIGSIADLVKEGVRDDKNAMDPQHNPKAEQIVTFLLDRIETENKKEVRDPLNDAINTPKGRCLEALINLALRSSRITSNDEEKREVWTKYKPWFDKQIIDIENGDYISASIMAMYIPNFMYLGKKWIGKNYQVIFPVDNPWILRSSLDGLSYVRDFYKEVYVYLRSAGIFKSAIEDIELKEHTVEKLIQYVAVAYFNDIESLDDKDGILNLFLSKKDISLTGHLIWFIWTLRKDDKDNNRGKVISLWENMIKEIDEPDSYERNLLSRLTTWCTYLEKLEGIEKDLLMKCAPYSEDTHNSYILLKELARLSDEYPVEAANILYSMLEKYAPEYEEENVNKIIEAVWKKDREGKLLADKIVDKYLEHGIDFPELFRRQLKNDNNIH